MKVISTGFEGLLVLEPHIIHDHRGHFFEAFRQDFFDRVAAGITFVQENQSFSTRAVFRGLHFQNPPYAQTKLVRAVAGSVLDMVVDLRREQVTYGKPFLLELSAANGKQLLVPKGFAHGFLVLSSAAEIVYKCDEFYHPESEGGIYFDDPQFGVQWPIPVGEMILSEKDRHYKRLAECPHGF